MATEEKTTAPFGTWKSEITTKLLTAKSVSIGAVDVYVSGKVEEEASTPLSELSTHDE